MEPKVFNNVEVFDDDAGFMEVMEIILENDRLSNRLSGGVVVVMETGMDGNYLQQCYGADVALKILKKDPERLVICVSFLPLEFVRNQNYIIDIVLQYPNAFFVRLPFNKDIFLELLDEAVEQKPSLLSNINRGEVNWKYASRAIGKAVHDMKVNDPKNPKDNYEQNVVRGVIEDVKDVFPSLENASNEEVIDFIYEASSEREEVMKDQEIEGVYCDIEGTLLVDQELNSDVVDTLKSYEEAGKKIIFWTDGDVDKLSSKLKELGINYPVSAKADFAGATAEIVIDDLDEFTFTARTKIHAKEFIQA